MNLKSRKSRLREEARAHRRQDAVWRFRGHFDLARAADGHDAALDDANVKFASSGGRAHPPARRAGGPVEVFVPENFHNRSSSGEVR